MITHVASGGKPGALTLISPGLEVQGRSRLESMAARASEAAIPIYTVHTRNDVTRTDFEDLAALSGGQFSADMWMN